MPLPDYSKFKADIKKPKASQIRKAKACALEADLNSLPLVGDMDEEARRRRSSGDAGYNMGFDLELAHPSHDNDSSGGLQESMQNSSSLQNSIGSFQREESMASLTDPFYDEEEEVTESYGEEEEEEEQNFNDSQVSIRSSTILRRRGKSLEDPRMSKSSSEASIGRQRARLPENLSRRPDFNNSAPDLDCARSMGSMDSNNKGKLGDFLDKSIKKGRKKTALLPGSTTEDLTSEMNEVVSMLSAKRGGPKRNNSRDGNAFPRNNARSRESAGSAAAASSGPPLRRSATDSSANNGKLRDYSQTSAPGSRLRDYSSRTSKSPGPARRTPRRSSSHDHVSSIRRTHSAEDGETRPRRGMPPKSKSADGSQRRLPTRTSTDPKSKTSHTHNSFVTGSRIRRIHPGDKSNLGNSMNLHASSSSLSRESSFRQKQRQVQRGLSPTKGGRSVSPKRRSKDHKKQSSKVSDSEVPPLTLS